MSIKKIPMRMCIVCRTHMPKKDLVRIVRNADGTIELDETGKKAGRGAYICNNKDCINKAIKTRACDRNFKTKVPENIYQEIDKIDE